jgi:predicted permease
MSLRAQRLFSGCTSVYTAALDSGSGAAMADFYLILVYLTVGAVLRRTDLMPDNTPAVLNAYVLYVAFPALILKTLPGLEFSAALLIPALTPWLLLIVSALLVLQLSRWLGWSREQTGALMIVVPLGNTSFLGYPLVAAFFGSAALPYAVVYDQLGSFFGLTVYATIVAAVYGASGPRPDLQSLVRRIVGFPSFLALVIGLVLIQVERPVLVASAINNFSATLVPVVMVAVGYQLSLQLGAGERSPLIWGLGIKLLLLPLLAWSLWAVLGQRGLAVQVSVFQAAMPSMISAGALASAAGLAPRLVAGLVGLGILLSLVTLPLLSAILRLLPQ